MVDNKDRLREFEHMWGSDKSCYALVPTGNSERPSGRYLIVDTRTGGAVLIENDALASEVISRMLSAGVFVVNPDDPQEKKERIKRRLGKT